MTCDLKIQGFRNEMLYAGRWNEVQKVGDGVLWGEVYIPWGKKLLDHDNHVSQVKTG